MSLDGGLARVRAVRTARAAPAARRIGGWMNGFGSCGQA